MKKRLTSNKSRFGDFKIENSLIVTCNVQRKDKVRKKTFGASPNIRKYDIQVHSATVIITQTNSNYQFSVTNRQPPT